MPESRGDFVGQTLIALLLPVLLLFGVNTTFWSAVGIGRYVVERAFRAQPAWRRPQLQARHRRTEDDRVADCDHPRCEANSAASGSPESPATFGCGPGIFAGGHSPTTPSAAQHHRDTADSTEAGTWHRYRPDDVAVLIPAHNEDAVIAETLDAATVLLPASNIHVVSDGSTDHTAEIAREYGVNVLELSPNRGKAGALLAAIRHFELTDNFQIVLLVDADSRLMPDYLETGLPEFDDPDVVAVAGHVKSLLDAPAQSLVGRFLIAYRSRHYAVMQLLLKYGQAARWANVVPLVPGCGSMYRTDVLDHIDIAAPGLVIEDFNMTFDVHAKKLGRIAYRPEFATVYVQDPCTLHDYVNQMRRWSLGFWQVVRLHGPHFGRFWLALLAQIAELVSSSVCLMFIPPLMLFLAYSDTLADTIGRPRLMGKEVVATLGMHYVFVGFFLPDLILTVVAAFALRWPRLLLFAPIFPAVRMVDAYICLRSVPTAFLTHSSGRWVSPTRRSSRYHRPRQPAAADGSNETRPSSWTVPIANAQSTADRCR